MAQTGRWDVPKYWTTPAYQKVSPWTAVELDAAFAALRRIFDPERTKAIFAEDERLETLWEDRRRKGLKPKENPKAERVMWPLFVDPWSAPVSQFLGLGLDAAACNAWMRESFIHGLTRDRTAFQSTCFEIAVYAALRQTGVSCLHEPLRPNGRPAVKNAPNPDFEIEVGNSSRYLLEVKRADEGDRASEEREWLTTLGMGTERTANIPYEIEQLDPEFGELQERDGGSWMRRNLLRLRDLVEDAKLTLVQSPTFPASTVVESCIRVTVRGPRNSVAGGGTMGVRMNSLRESKRILGSLLAKAVRQIPPDRPGIILLNPGWSVDSECIREEVRRWLISANEGVLYPQVFGVAIIARQYSLDYALALSVVMPVFRPSAPTELSESDVWGRLSAGLSLHELRRYAFQSGLGREGFAEVLARFG